MLNRRHFLAVLTGASWPLVRIPRRFGETRQPAERRWSGVQAVLDAYVGKRAIAGAVTALSYADAPVTYLTAGRIALDSDRRPDENSIYRMYSTTKVVTGIAAMRLIQDGRLRLDQPVAEVLPEWKSLRVAIDVQKGLESRPARITMTMRHLLTHTSGLAYWIPSAGSGLLPTIYRERGITPGDYYDGTQGRPGYGPQAKDLSEMIARLAELPLAADPGTVYQYSVGYDVMGLIIERSSGTSLEAYFREQIFEPLKMTSSGFQVPASQAARLTTNYEVSADGLTPIDRGESSVFLRPPSLVAGGGGLVSTARDFARFTGMLFGRGTFDGVQVLREDIARLACSDLLPQEVASDAAYGAGMRITKIPKQGPSQPGPLQPGPVGTLSFGGAAGCRWMVEPARHGRMVIMTQRMPGPANGPLWNELHRAVDADLG
jgi:CubicO group peptidase (beta-lactamase class C family)